MVHPGDRFQGRSVTVLLDDGRVYRKLVSAAFDQTAPGCRFQVLVDAPAASMEQVSQLVSVYEAKEAANRKDQEDAQRLQSERLAQGQEIARRLIPADCKALIVAERRRDTSDSQSDYFGSVVVDRVVLATSKHTRDTFSEMRKAALGSRIPEIMELGTAGVEHREKYSMGAGYYFGSSRGRNADGWTIRKVVKGSDWAGEVLESLAVLHCL